MKAFWKAVGSEADGHAQDFVQRASELSLAQPHVDAWQICDPMEADVIAFVHRAAGGGDGVFSHETAGNFAVLAEAVEVCMRQAREMQCTLEALEGEYARVVAALKALCHA